MADTIWTNGAAGRDFNAAGDFSGTVPEGTGTLYFIADYSAENTGPNANMAAHTAVDQDAIYVGPGFTESIGASGNDMDISVDRIYHGGEGKMWFKDGAGTTDWILVSSTAPSPTTSVMNITGATVTRLDVLRGGVTVDGSGTVTNVFVGRQTSANTDANLILSSGATISTIAEQWAGNTASDAAIPTLRLMNGTWTQATATITTLHVFGGRLNFNFAGTIANVYHYDGIIDTTQSGALKTFTNYWWMPGAREQLIATPETLAVGTEYPGTRSGAWA